MGKVIDMTKNDSFGAAKKSCYAHPVTPLFEFKNGHTLFAGSVYSVELAIERGTVAPKLVIDASNSFHLDIKNPVKPDERALLLLPESVTNPSLPEPPAVLHLDWTDGGVPSILNRAWWVALAEACRTLDGDVTVSCVGGHGRTGTVLAILMTMLGGVEDNEDPIEVVREVYCDDAVETWAQVRYIEKILERKSKAKPSELERRGNGVATKAQHTATWDDDDDDGAQYELPRITSTGAQGNLQVSTYEDGSKTVYNKATGTTTFFPSSEDKAKLAAAKADEAKGKGGVVEALVNAGKTGTDDYPEVQNSDVLLTKGQ